MSCGECRIPAQDNRAGCWAELTWDECQEFQKLISARLGPSVRSRCPSVQACLFHRELVETEHLSPPEYLDYYLQKAALEEW